MFSNVLKWSVGLVVIGLFWGCSEYNKILKSNDTKLKYEKAVEYYENGKYFKAYPIFEELRKIYVGTGRAEDLFYYVAYCEYYLGNYVMAAYSFEEFHKTFSKSQRSEECQFMAAYCHYLNSPSYSLDQTNTYTALSQMQLFINKFPNTTRMDTVNALMDKLRAKLETKAYNLAHLHYKMRYYKSAIVSFENLVKDFPDSDYREEARYMIVKSNFDMAVNSVDKLKEERFDNTIKAYYKFIDLFPKSGYLRDAERIYDSSLKEKEKLNTTNS